MRRPHRAWGSRSHQNTLCKDPFFPLEKTTGHSGHYGVQFAGTRKKDFVARGLKPGEHGLEEMHARVLFEAARLAWQHRIISPVGEAKF